MTDDDDADDRETPTPDWRNGIPRPPTDSERQRHLQRYRSGVPVVMSDEDRALQSRRNRAPHAAPPQYNDEDGQTGPFDLFAPERRTRRRRGDSAVELAAKLRRDAPDPYDLIAALAFELTDAKEDDRTGRKELEKRLSAFLDVQPGGAKFDEIAAAITELRNQSAELAPVRRGLRWLQASVVVVVVGIGGWLYARGGEERETRLRIQALEKQVEALSARELERVQRELAAPRTPLP